MKNCIILLLCFSSISNVKSQNFAKGKKIYEIKCLSCHQADGGGVPNMNAPLDGATNVIGNNISRIYQIIKNGYNERIALDGYFYSNAMTPNPDLKDQDIVEVINYIRNAWSNKAGTISLSQLKQQKKK